MKFIETFNSLNNINDIWSSLPAFDMSIIPIILAGIAYWIYTSLAWQTTIKKLGHSNPWLAWIPFARKAVVLDITGFNWRLIFIALIPMLIILIKVLTNSENTLLLLAIYLIATLTTEIITKISFWIVFKKRGYYGWLAIIPAISWFSFPTNFPVELIVSGIFLVSLGFVAWKDKKTIHNRHQN